VSVYKNDQNILGELSSFGLCLHCKSKCTDLRFFFLTIHIHFRHDWFPISVFTLIPAQNDSVGDHFKMVDLQVFESDSLLVLCATSVSDQMCVKNRSVNAAFLSIQHLYEFLLFFFVFLWKTHKRVLYALNTIEENCNIQFPG